jgi:hypothetical protein
VEWRQPRDHILMDHSAPLPRGMAVRATKHVVNEAQRKVKDRKKK